MPSENDPSFCPECGFEMWAEHEDCPRCCTALPLEAVREPCNDCPWRREALPGWLGPHDAERWIEIVLSDTAIACHKTIRRDKDWEGTLQCRGAASFRANISKVPRDSRVVTGPTDHERIFSTPEEFIDHHKGGLKHEDFPHSP